VTEASSTDSVSSFATTVMAYVNTSGEMIKHMNSTEVSSPSSKAERKLTLWKLG
jgi:hypothetical protein